MELIGYFRSLKEANKAVKILKNSGFHNASSDMNDHYIEENDVHINLAGTETAPSLSGLVMQSGDSDLDMSKRALAAADPAVSGMSDFDEITDINNRVIVKTNSDNLNDAKKIISDAGGTLEDPDVKIPKGLENIEFEEINADNMNLD